MGWTDSGARVWGLVSGLKVSSRFPGLCRGSGLGCFRVSTDSIGSILRTSWLGWGLRLTAWGRCMLT